MLAMSGSARSAGSMLGSHSLVSRLMRVAPAAVLALALPVALGAACGKKSTALDFAALEKGDLSGLPGYLSAGGDPNARHAGPTAWTLLHFAARWGKQDACESLVAKGAKVDATTSDGWTPLFFAALNGHAGVAKFLLARGAAVNHAAADGSMPLDIADGDEVTAVLVAAGARRGAPQ